ncbi:MAG TPA: PAS domain-containing protein, partial [Tepidisphaeraceae bacterium]|nr:PAS domain-containing protein [Tepidisphaeraceae bacterium]
MAARVRAFDWAATPLGPMAQWPEALRVAVDICLSSRFPMFVWWGPQLVNIYNDAYVPILGKRHPAALGRPARDTWADIWADVGPQADAVMRRGEATWNERVKLVMERNGYPEDTYFTWSYSPIRDASGAIAGLFCACTEETERVRAEAALHTSEERLALAIGSSDLGTFYCPMPLGRIEWNDTCKAHFWLPPDADVDFDLFYARIHPDDRDRTRQAVERAVFGHGPYDVEYRTFAPDGRQRWVRAKGRAYYDDAGNPVRFDGITLDVTERRRAEDALRDSERRFREMADTAPAMLWVTEPDGYCSFLSRGWYEFTGQTEQEGLGFGWTNAAHPDDREAAGEAFVAANAGRAAYAVDFRVRR